MTHRATLTELVKVRRPMRKITRLQFSITESSRIKDHHVLASSKSDGNNGAFTLLSPESGWVLWVIASDGEGWEHVSVQACVGYPSGKTIKSRIPTWKEMCYVKGLFWDDEDEVIQFHPKKSEYVNCHPHVLHLWRPISHPLPRPPSILVGPKA